MLAAIRSVYAGSTLAVHIDITASSAAASLGSSAVQQVGVQQGCPLSPTLFGSFFVGLHDHLMQHAPTLVLQLDCGRWVSSLAYADDAVLLFYSGQSQQALIDSTRTFCANKVDKGLTISPTKTEVVVIVAFHGPAAGSWHVGRQRGGMPRAGCDVYNCYIDVFPVSTSFKYLGLMFHESGSLTSALTRLLQIGNEEREGSVPCNGPRAYEMHAWLPKSFIVTNPSQ